MDAIDAMISGAGGNPYVSSANPIVFNGAPQASAPPVPVVYMGSKNVQATSLGPKAPDPFKPAGESSRYEGPVDVPVDKSRTLDKVLLEFEKASKKEHRRMAFLLALAGRFGALEDLSEASMIAREIPLGKVMTTYEALLTEASDAYMVRGHKITPEQILKRDIAYRLPGKVEWDGKLDSLDTSLKNAGVHVGPGVSGKEEEEEEDLDSTTTQTSVSRNFMDPADAKALVRGLLQNELGRDPTAGEFDEFLAAIHSAERNHPGKSTVTQRVVEDPDTGDVSMSTRTRTTEGISAAGIQDMALEKVRQQPGWAEWQAVGVYGPALMSALGATVPGR